METILSGLHFVLIGNFDIHLKGLILKHGGEVYFALSPKVRLVPMMPADHIGYLCHRNTQRDQKDGPQAQDGDQDRKSVV